MLQTAESFLRAIAADDLDGCGCYVLAMDEIGQTFPELRREFVLAYTGLELASALRPWLESQGRWQGDGFCCVVMRSEIPSWREVLGIAVHELAHWIAWPTAQPTEQASALRHMAAFAASDPGSNDVPPWRDHGRDFCRAATHLAYRAGLLMESVRPSLVRFSMAYTGVPEATWIEILRDEIQCSGPIREILKTPPQKRFTELWNEIEGI